MSTAEFETLDGGHDRDDDGARRARTGPLAALELLERAPLAGRLQYLDYVFCVAAEADAMLGVLGPGDWLRCDLGVWPNGLGPVVMLKRVRPGGAVEPGAELA